MHVATHGHQERALDLAGFKVCGEPPDMSAGN